MENITIVHLIESPGIAVFYNPAMIMNMGLDEPTLTEFQKSGQLQLVIPPIINGVLMPLLIEHEGMQYADWIPVALLFGKIPAGGILPILHLVHDQSEIINKNFHAISEDESLKQSIEQYIDDYMYTEMRHVTETPNKTNDTDTYPEYFMFRFDNLTNALNICTIVSFDKCKNAQMWKYKNKYYIIFDSERSTAENISAIIAEYDGMEEPSYIAIEHIAEHGECIVKDIIQMQKVLT